MVNNILIEVLGAVAEQGRKKTKQRQAESIAAMPVVDGKRVSVKIGRGSADPLPRLMTSGLKNSLKNKKTVLLP